MIMKLFYFFIFIALSGCSPSKTTTNDDKALESDTQVKNEHQTSPPEAKNFITLNSKDNLESCMIFYIDSKYKGSLPSPYESTSTNREYINKVRNICTKDIQESNDYCQEIVKTRKNLCQGAITRTAKICAKNSACIAESKKMIEKNCPFYNKQGTFNPNFWPNVLAKYPQGFTESNVIIQPEDVDCL